MWNVFSFFLTNEESFIEINTNIFETNLINLIILIGLLIYGNKISFQPTLKIRQKEISQNIENAQKDVVIASNFYSLSEQGFMQSIFWLQAWKKFYQNEKLDIVKNKYKLVENGINETFLTAENLINNFENKSFLSLQRYILFLAASRILRKFLSLSENEQSQIVENTILKLGGGEK